MKKLMCLVVFVLAAGFCYALEVDFSCPRKVEVDEEFECVLEVRGGEGVYDMKVELVDGKKTLAEIWDGDKWKSVYYYLYEFIDDGKEKVKLRIIEDVEGDLEGVVKLRQGDTREFFDFDIEVGGGGGGEDEEEGEDSNVGNSEGEVGEIKTTEKEVIMLNQNETRENVINLNSQQEVKQTGNVIYESKNQKITDYAIYFFAGFLILVIVVLLIWR